MNLQNSVAWDLPGSVGFFENERNSAEKLYKSEWLFIKDLLKENISVLDIGCALGGFADICKQKLNNFSYTGLDISQKMIEKAKYLHPEFTFHHIEEADLSVVQGQQFDLVLCLGILHLSFKWRELIQAAWKVTHKNFVLDLRETDNHTLENIDESFFKMDFNCNDSIHNETKLPYIIVNSSDSLKLLRNSFGKTGKISHYGYIHPVSGSAVTKEKEVMMNVYCVEKIANKEGFAI